MLAKQEIRGEIFIVGGAAMAMAYNTRRSTRDIDAVFEPKMKVYEAAEAVAELNPKVETGWLNDAVKGLLPGVDPDATVLFTHEGLTVRVASPGYLFAMKVAAARVERDADDIAELYKILKFESVKSALDFLETNYPNVVLLPRAQYLLEDVAGLR